ncbi:MAG: hypothetical protein V4602_06400 [Pseudomonadota bacterium]
MNDPESEEEKRRRAFGKALSEDTEDLELNYGKAAAIVTVADLVASLLRLPQDAKVILSDSHEFETTVAVVREDEGDVVIFAGNAARKYAAKEKD